MQSASIAGPQDGMVETLLLLAVSVIVEVELEDFGPTEEEEEAVFGTPEEDDEVLEEDDAAPKIDVN